MLRLMPHKDENARIQCQLVDYSLHELSEGTRLYEGLSYVWGGPGYRQSISIDKHDMLVTAISTPHYYVFEIDFLNESYG